jgi:hypothetical protein
MDNVVRIFLLLELNRYIYQSIIMLKSSREVGSQFSDVTEYHVLQMPRCDFTSCDRFYPVIFLIVQPIQVIFQIHFVLIDQSISC